MASPVDRVELARRRSDLVRLLRKGSQRVQADFTDPDDDWVFTMFGMNRRGEAEIVAADAAFFSSDETKDNLVAALSQITREREYVALATLVSTWRVEYEKGSEGYDDPFRVMPSQHPDRREALMIVAVDRYGDEVYMADIVRHDGAPPTLEPWERQPGDQHTGRFIEPLRTALRPQG